MRKIIYLGLSFLLLATLITLHSYIRGQGENGVFKRF